MKRDDSFHFLSIFLLILIFALGFIVTGILNFYLNKQKQTTRSNAAGPIQEATCTNLGGECQSGKLNEIDKPCTLSSGTPGTVKFNLCPSQGEDIRCCVPNKQNQTAGAGLTVSLQGIGPNANIVDKERTATIKIYDNSKPFNSATYTSTDKLTYDPQSGNFTNPNFNLGNVPEGEYQMVIQIDTYLDEQLKTVSGENIFIYDGTTPLKVATAQMRAGDLAPGSHGDNHVNIIDYNAIIGCMAGAPPGSCLNKKYADLNDDGIVDQKDLDILLLNFGSDGFSFQTDEYTCEPDPSCNSGKESLQLCSLLCSRKSNRS